MNKRYFLTTEMNGITYYLHENGTLHWFLMDGGLKTYKRYGSAIQAANRLAREKHLKVSVYSALSGQYLHDATHVVTTLGCDNPT